MVTPGNGQILKDPYCRKILKLCFSNSRTANFLSMKMNIPIAVCLSKLNQMERCGLIIRDKKISTSQGKWVQLYRSLVMESGEAKKRSDFNERCNFSDFEDVIS